MNILLINHYAISPRESGGGRHYKLARYLIQKGHQVHVVGSSFNHHQKREAHLSKGELSKLETIDEVPFLWVRTPPYSGNSIARFWNMVMFGYRLLTSAVDKYELRPDIIIGSSPHLLGAFAAKILAKRHKVPFVFEIRDIWPQALVEVGNFSPYHPLILIFRWIEKHLYLNSQHMITLLPGAEEYIASMGGKKENITWLPNGVDLSILPPYRPTTEKEKLTFMYAGAHGPTNGLDIILDAAAIVQDQDWGNRVEFRFVGDGVDKNRLQQRAIDEKIRNIKFDKPVPKSMIYPILQEADAFFMVLTDSPVFRWGISPNKLFDYMGIGRPVIFSVNTPLNPVEKASSGLSVPAGDLNGMVNAIQSLVNLSSSERNEIGLRGKRYVEENHDTSKLADRLEHIILRAIR